MHQRDHDRRSAPGQARSQPTLPRRSVHPVVALQRLIGNRGATQVLARKGGGSGKGTFENSVKVGKLGPIEIKGGNLADWIAKKDPETLTVTSTKGKHSDELKRMSESKERIDTIEVQAILGENSFVVITFSHARIKGYAAGASDKTEEWTVVDFDAVHRAKTSIGAAR
jgi:hypothetical protein